ncbi:MAG: outer membrane lipoprotein-sorting protein [Gammaproteobacteria bacterium]|nr:outer membrane lipoprotein-sorting protein [Gammaproteobacteria bacterium]
MRNGLLVSFFLALPWTGLAAQTALDLELERLAPEAAGRAIFEAADQRASGYADMQVELEMILRSSRGAENRRLLRIRQLEVPEDGDKLLVVFDTPKPIKGTALLSYSHKRDPDDQWLYLPAMKRVKKIASRNKSGPFLSSEFSYEDLTVQEVEKFSYRFLRREALDGLPCYVVERTPLDDHSGYTRQVVWVDEAELRVQQIEYYDRRDSLLKLLAIEDYERYGDQFWKAGRMFMTNQQTRKSTELVWRNYQFGTGLVDERDFSTNSLLRVR